MRVIERAKELRAKIESLTAHMTDEEAKNNSELLPKWKPVFSYFIYFNI